MPRSPAPPKDWPKDRPELLPFLPLVYAAWSDGVLSGPELASIRDRASSQEWLDEEARAALANWLDPARPPSALALTRLKDRLRSLGGGEAGETLPRTETDDLAAYLQRPRPEVRQAVLDLLATDEFSFPPDLPRSEHREKVLLAVRRIAETGMGALAFPTAVGGGGDPGAALAVFETLGFGDGSVMIKYGVQFGLFGGSILNLGTERHQAYLRDVGSLALPGCYAMTETGHGSNVRDMETTARYDAKAGEFVVDTPHAGARKDWIGNAALHGRMATVFARLIVAAEDHGVHALLVPIRDDKGTPLPGIDIEDRGAKVGLEGLDNGLIRFTGVRVPRANLLDRFASVDAEGRYTSPIPSADRRFFTMLGTLVEGRISIAAASVSAAKVGLTVALRWTAKRRQFGPGGGAEVPLLHYLNTRRRLLVPLAATYGLHFAVRTLTDRYTERMVAEMGGHSAPGDEEGRRIEVEAAGLKAYASRHCVETLQSCREACGGQGYLAANRFGRLRADTDVFTTLEGANAVLQQLVAKGLLSQYKEEMSDLRLWGMVRHLADRAETRFIEMNPLSVRRTDSDHLRDPEFQAAALEYREERLLASAGRRLRALIGDGVESFEALNRVQDHLLALADAHVERVVHQAFQDAVAHAPSPGSSERLASLSSLWTLSRLEADRGWFLESGYFEAPKARAIRAEVNALCGDVAEHAVELVAAFGIPDGVLKAPAGLGV